MWIGCDEYGWNSISNTTATDQNRIEHGKDHVRWIPVSKQCGDGGNPFCEITLSSAVIKHLILLQSRSCVESAFQIDASMSSGVVRGGGEPFSTAMFDTLKKNRLVRKLKNGNAQNF